MTSKPIRYEVTLMVDADTCDERIVKREINLAINAAIVNELTDSVRYVCKVKAKAKDK